MISLLKNRSINHLRSHST